MPADIDNAADSTPVLNDYGSVVFDAGAVDGAREAPARTPRLAEEIVQQIDAMRADVVERSAARLGRVEQPGAPSVLGGEPRMAGGVGQHGFPDHALFQQLPGPIHLGVSAPIVSDAQRPP